MYLRIEVRAVRNPATALLALESSLGVLRSFTKLLKVLPPLRPSDLSQLGWAERLLHLLAEREQPRRVPHREAPQRHGLAALLERRGHGERSRLQLLFKLGGTENTENLFILAVSKRFGCEQRILGSFAHFKAVLCIFRTRGAAGASRSRKHHGGQERNGL